MNGNQDDWEAQLAEYTLGTMEPGAAAEFERSLNECRAHVVLSNQYAQMLGVLGSAVSPAEPPLGHKERFMARLAATPQPETAAPLTPVPPVTSFPAPVPTADGGAGARVTDIGEYRERRRQRVGWPAIAAIAAVLVLLVGGIAWFNSLSANQRINIPEDAIVFPVQGTGPQTGATALGVVDPSTNQAYLLTNGLQPIPANQVYELWWLPPTGQGAPVPAGTFTVDASGKALHSNMAPQPVSSYAGLAVTLEPAPGVDAPTGPIVLAGNYTIP